MSKPFLLTVKAVKAAAKRAYERKRLSAQAEDPAFRECVYTVEEDHRFHCVVGAALPASLRRKLLADPTLNAASVGVLADKGVITFVSRQAKKAIQRLQSLHDSWASAEGYQLEDAENYKKKLLAAIRH